MAHESRHLRSTDPNDSCEYKVACGRHKGRRGGRYVTGLVTTSVASMVDCVMCQRTAAYKALVAAEPPKPADLFPTMFKSGQKVAGFNSTAMIQSYDARNRCYLAIWANGDRLYLYQDWAHKFTIVEEGS